jgi:tRNA threonylcarbamoyladenosine biosynthesis protein TsaB
MITLALDTSTALGSVALLRDGQPLAEETFRRSAPKQHLFGALQHLLASQQLAVRDLGAIIVGVGPGSFTGIRAGIAAAQGLALPRALPVSAVSSFDALALTALPQLPAGCQQLCVVGDARRDELYFAFYDTGAHRTGAIQLGAIPATTGATWFVGSEIDRLRPRLSAAPGGIAPASIYPRATAVGQLPPSTLELAPIYLREPQYKKLCAGSTGLCFSGSVES